MLTKFALIKTAMVGKSPGVAWLLSASVAWIASALTPPTNTWGTIIFVAGSGAIGAFFTAWPKIIAARSGASGDLVARLTKFHHEEKTALQAQLKTCRDTQALNRISKHALIDEINRFTIRNMRLEIMLSDAGIPVPEFHPNPIKELLSVEDKGVEKMVSKNEGVD